MIILASIAKLTKSSKAFLILTGVSAACIFFSIISFGWIVYMLFIKLFGESSKSGWIVNGVVILFQLALLIGAVGSIVLTAKKKVIRLAGSSI